MRSVTLLIGLLLLLLWCQASHQNTMSMIYTNPSKTLPLNNPGKRLTILVLGCHMEDILDDRMKTAIEFANNQPSDVQITWYLSGGTKYKLDHMIINNSEATKMAGQLDQTNNKNWKYHLDTKATNTAENFAYFRKWLESQDVSEVYITTSSFHHKRARSIVEGILGKIKYNWLLGKLGYTNCIHDESIHSINISNDIKKAINKYEML